jgi:AAA+ ATPase superfamily predicted ATPase
MMNPFKYGSVVDDPHFINRKNEIEKVSALLNSENHLILISPRRYGKTSLIRKVLNVKGIRSIYLDMQLIMSGEDFASQLLKRIYKISTIEKVKGYIKTFRIVPTLSINAITGEPDVSFRNEKGGTTPLEDVLNLLDKIGSANDRIVVALDEFQEIFRIGKGYDRLLRSIMQHHKHVNYIFAGSSESMLREIFEHKKSPFYHFGELMILDRIPEQEFIEFLNHEFEKISKSSELITKSILSVTESHPYYTQQLSSVIWRIISQGDASDNFLEKAIHELLSNHDNDYERIWNGLNRTDMKILLGLSESEEEPMSNDFIQTYINGAKSTVYSALQKLMKNGIVVKENSIYSIDDPFFKRWILKRRQM